MHPMPGLVCSRWPEGRFQVSILPWHRPFVRFAFKGRAWQYKVLTFRLSLFPPCLYEDHGGCPCPVIGSGYQEPQLSQRLSHHGPVTRSVVRSRGPGALAPQPVGASGSTCVGNLFPHYGVRLGEYDGASHQRVLNCLSSFRGRTVVPLKHFQSLLGHMASTATVTQLGLLHMIPLQHWLHSRVPRWAWHCGTHCVTITPMCCHSFSPWLDLAFLRAGVPLEQVSRHVIVRTNASSTGWGTTMQWTAGPWGSMTWLLGSWGGPEG